MTSTQPTLSVLPEEAEFLKFYYTLFRQNHWQPPTNPPKLQGLTPNAQKYLAKFLANHLLLYLIEKGATIPGILIENGQRHNQAHLLTTPLQFHFSANLYQLLYQLYTQSPLHPSYLQASTSAESLTHLILADKLLPFCPHSTYILNIVQKIISNSFLAYLLHWRELTTPLPSLQTLLNSAKNFLNLEYSHKILYSLRFYLLHQDKRHSKPRYPLEEKQLQRHQQRSELFVHLFQTLTQKKLLHLFEPFCYLYQLHYQHDHLTPLKQHIENTSPHEIDQRKLKQSYLQIHQWAQKLEELQNTYAQLTFYDEDFELAGVFKHHFQKISILSRENFKKLIHYLQNTI